jgi:hypothetical protein
VDLHTNLTWARDFGSYSLIGGGEEVITEESKKVSTDEAAKQKMTLWFTTMERMM